VSVLIIANSGHIGGGDKVVMDVMTGLDLSRFRPILVVPTLGALSDWARSNNVRCILNASGDWQSRAGLLRRTMSLAAIILREQVGIIHASAPTCFRAAGLAGRLTGAARICHLGFPPSMKELEYAFLSFPDAVVGCYRQQIDDVAGLWPALVTKTQMLSIVNAVDTDVFFPGRPDDNSPYRFGGKHVVAIVGHLSRVKGHPVFIQAAARIAKRVPGCAFVAAGNDSVERGFRRELEQMAAAAGIDQQLHFLGWTASVADFLRSADVIVQPSRAEGLPLAVLEAMACGKPVIATPVGGVPEAIVDGLNGVLVDVDDADAIAEAAVRMICDERFANELGAAARRSAEEHFSKPRFMSEVQDLYTRLSS
jgi:glycosyltransferase involved in cell wall biosynthesis